jgi:hypothetical protein
MYSHEIPYFIKDLQMILGIQPAKMEYDEIWIKEEEQLQESNIHDDRERHLNKIL